MSVIDENISVRENYRNLLEESRRLAKREDSGEAVCFHCDRPKANHLHDGRCSIYATSREFKNNDANRIWQVSKALELIEELLK